MAFCRKVARNGADLTMASTGEMVLFFLAIFGILTVAYGASVGNSGAGNVQDAMTAITSPILSPTQVYTQLLAGTPKCSPVDFACQIQQGVAQATALIAVVIGYIPYLLFEVLSRLLDFGVLVNAISQNPSGTGSIPFGTLFIFGLLMFVLFDVVKILRGNPSGV